LHKLFQGREAGPEGARTRRSQKPLGHLVQRRESGEVVVREEEEVAGEGGDVDEEGEEDSLKTCYNHSLILSPCLGPGGCLALSPPRRLMSAVWRKFKGINSM
jgi:hypothetical protein